MKSRYNITRPSADGEGTHKAGPFDMGILLDTLTKVRQEQTKLSSEEASQSIAGLKTILAKKDKSKEPKAKPSKKFVKDVTIRTINPRRTSEGGNASLSDVKLFERTMNKEDFDKTLVDIQQKTATEAFNTMQLIVRTMTGILPVSLIII